MKEIFLVTCMSNKFDQSKLKYAANTVYIPSFVLMASSNVSSLNHGKCLRANWRIEKAEDDECLDSKKRHQRILLLRDLPIR